MDMLSHVLLPKTNLLLCILSESPSRWVLMEARTPISILNPKRANSLLLPYPGNFPCCTWLRTLMWQLVLLGGRFVRIRFCLCHVAMLHGSVQCGGDVQRPYWWRHWDSCAYGMTLAMNSVAHSFGSPGFSSILRYPVELPILLFWSA